jgi:DNA-binding NtrC family response regulator
MSHQDRILVVDDEEAICDVLREFLSGEGYRVECAHDGTEARATLEGRDVALVILDVLLPGERGLELADDAAAMGIPVVLMSGHPEFIPIADGSSYPTMRKPFRLDEVGKMVRTMTAAPISQRPDATPEDRCSPSRS